MRWYWWTALGLGGLYMLSKKSAAPAPAVAAATQPITTAGGAVEPITVAPATGIVAVDVAQSASTEMLIQTIQAKYGLSVTNVSMTQNPDGTLTFTGQQLSPDEQSYVTVHLGTFKTASDAVAWATSAAV